MTWALKRQIFFLAVFLCIILGAAYFLFAPLLHKEPTCMDNKQNGLETGVDCGGNCAMACINQVDPLTVLWSRIFKVVDGRYNAVAYLQNHNSNAAIRKISYRFRFADKDNLYIGKRDGETFVPPSGKFAIFEPAIGVGNSVPVYTTFEFTEVPIWEQVSDEKVDQLQIHSSDIRLEDEETAPKLFATIKNRSLFTIPEVTVVSILYDDMGNALSASRTYVDVLAKEATADISFTWPEPFSKKVVVKEIIPMFDVFLASLK